MNRFLNRQKQLMLAMAGVLMLTVSCSQDVDNELGTTDSTSKVGSEVKLQFATNAVTTTRGTMYDNIGVMPDDSKFSVYGYSCKGGFDQMGNTPNFIANGEASKDGTVTVDDAVKHYNSQEPYVQLAAVYPKLEGNNSFEKTGADQYSLTYDIGAGDDATLHKDLMIGKTNVVVKAQEEQQPAVITLHHALTAVNFAIGDKCPTGYIIAGIEMQGLAAKGTCEVTFNDDMPTFNWTPSDTKENIRLKWPKYEGARPTDITPNKTTQVNRTQVTGVETDGKRDNLTIFMIPQQLGADAKAVIWLTKDNETFRDPIPAANETENRANVKKLTINLAAAKSWQPGQTVVYGIDEQLTDADLRYKFDLYTSTITSTPGADGLSTGTFRLNSYRYTYKGRAYRDKTPYDLFAALQTFQISKYAYEDETGMHETVTNELPDWVTLTATPKVAIKRVYYDIEVKADHTKPSYPAGIKKLRITFKQDTSELAERTVEITGLQPKASN